MKIDIGSTIAQLRRKGNITQEQLAMAVGVSAPAVSKWETGQSYPDITLLAPLARYFGVSVDTLLAYEPKLTEEAQEALLAETSQAFSESGWAAGLAYCDRLLREYPSDMELRVLLSGNLMANLVFATGEAERNEGRARQIEWLQEASEKGEGQTQLSASYLLGMFYLGSRQLQEAERILEPLQDLELVNVRQSMPTLRMLQERYDDAALLSQRNLAFAVNELVTALVTMANVAIKQEKLEDAIRYADACETALTALDMDKPHRLNLASVRMSIAQAAKDDAGLLTAAEAYANALVDLRSPIHSSIASLVYDGIKSPALGSAQNQAMLQTAAEGLENSKAFADMRDEPRFQRILAALRHGE